MKKVFLALSMIIALAVTSCKQVESTETETTATDSTEVVVDTVVVDTTTVELEK
jgi:hypothetical protein